jgi:hypothetical protein
VVAHESAQNIDFCSLKSWLWSVALRDLVLEEWRIQENTVGTPGSLLTVEYGDPEAEPAAVSANESTAPATSAHLTIRGRIRWTVRRRRPLSRNHSMHG